MSSYISLTEDILEISSLIGSLLLTLQGYEEKRVFKKKINDYDLTANTLNNIATIQSSERNYIGSDSNIIKAIRLLQRLPQHNINLERLFLAYNGLGINSKHQKQFSKAIKYHKKSLEVNSKISDKEIFKQNYIYARINMAEAYKAAKKYNISLSIYEELLNKMHLYHTDRLSYAAILNNKAHSRFLSNDNDIKRIHIDFCRAYKISDSLNAKYEIASIGNDMAEFYYHINKKDSSLILSKRSYKLSKEIKRYYETSRALLTLSKLEQGEKGKQYLYEHIKLNDSLLDIERASRNKFARIQFETDTYIDQTKRLATQNILIVVIALILILLFALLFIIRGQQTKNKVLRYESEQQKANEEIYTLMLKQRSKLEEGRMRERFRIAEELHDGILSKLCGSRLGLEYLSINGDVDKDKYKYYMKEFRTIEEEIRNISHDLKNSEFFSEKDFITILEDYVMAQGDLHEFLYDINNDDSIDWTTIDDDIKVNLYRIIQEAIQNIIKHAKATRIEITCTSIKSNWIRLSIKDNGIGFNIKQHQDGIGLKNIKSRSKKLKGKFKIESNTTGSILRIKVPVNQVNSK